MDSNVRISCIVPTLNRGMVLCDSIRCLLNQIHAAHEIIVVDQSPSQAPDVRKLLDGWQAQGLIVTLHQKTPNASAARNRGACSATGDVLLFLDDDILVSPEFLHHYANAFSDFAVKGVAGQVLEGDCTTTDHLPPEALDPESGWLYFPRNYSQPAKTNWMISCNAAVRTKDFFEVGGMDENYFRGANREESDFSQRWVRSGRHFCFHPECSVHHLGVTKVPGGGARNWNQDGPLLGWHHHVGSWYFLLGHGTHHNITKLLSGDLRAAGFTKRNLRRPWWIPVAFLRWIAAFPVALLLRIRGPRLATTGSRTQ